MTQTTLKSPPLLDDHESEHINVVEAMDDPYPFYRSLRELAPIVAIRSQGVTYYHANGWDAATAVLNDKRFSKDQARIASAIAGSGRTGAQSGFVLSGSGLRNLLNTDPPDHTRLRNLVQQAFSPGRMRALEDEIATQIELQLAGLADKGEADLIADYAYPIAINMICSILGIPAKDKNDFRLWATAASTPHIVPDAPITQAEGAQRLKDYLAALVARIRSGLAQGEEAGDLLSAMAQVQEAEDALSDDELLAMAFLLLIAGHETTVGLIGATLLRLGREPDQRTLLLERPELIKSAIDEFLRMDGSVQRTTFRVATEDLEIEGYLVPKGAIMCAALPTANRDPSRFEDPERYDVTRKPKPNLAFGSGPHFCLGRNLARLETMMAVQAFITRFPDYVPGKPDWALTVIRAPTRLPARLTPGGDS